MSKEYKLRYEDKFHITNRGDAVTVRWKDNDCKDIKKGDTIVELVRIRDGETDTQTYEVIGVEMFEKAFHKMGDNMSILIKPKFEVIDSAPKRFDYKPQKRYAVYEREPQKCDEPNSIILGDYSTFCEAQKAREKYGFNTDNYYVDEVKYKKPTKR
jgi:hypothetical protein